LWKSNEISKGSFYGQLAGCHCETPRYPEFVLKALTKGSKPCLSSDNYFTKKYDVTVSTLFGQNIDGAPPPWLHRPDSSHLLLEASLTSSVG